MLSTLLAFALRQRVLVVVMACILTVGGVYAFRTIAIDAFPDVTTVLVQVVTKVPGMSPAEVERFVTFPMELQLMGAPGLTDIRSFSKVGLSMITVVFKDDIDIYLARQVVLERILEIQELLPPGSSSQLVPNTTGSRSPPVGEGSVAPVWRLTPSSVLRVWPRSVKFALVTPPPPVARQHEPRGRGLDAQQVGAAAPGPDLDEAPAPAFGRLHAERQRHRRAVVAVRARPVAVDRPHRPPAEPPLPRAGSGLEPGRRAPGVLRRLQGRREPRHAPAPAPSRL